MQTNATHRPSFEDDVMPNTFWSIDRNGDITIDGQIASRYELADMPESVKNAFAFHAEHGYHLGCVICQSDPRTVMEVSNAISEALKGQKIDEDERAKLWSELAEIHAWLQNDYPSAVSFWGGEVVEIYPTDDGGEMIF